MTTERPGLEVGARVHVRSDHIVGECHGIITAAEYDDGWLYRIDVIAGDRLDDHRDDKGELWVCEFEVQRRPEVEASA